MGLGGRGLASRLTHLLVDLAELLQVVLEEDDPLPLGQASAGLVTVILTLRRETGSQGVTWPPPDLYLTTTSLLLDYHLPTT